MAYIWHDRDGYVLHTCRMIGTGSALMRNELLRHFLAAQLADPLAQLQLQNAVDAAVGAAIAPVLLH